MDLMRFIQKAMGPLKRQVRLMVGRGIIHLVNDAAKEQEVQISLLDGEVKDGVERYQEYGFTSIPLPGIRPIVWFLTHVRDEPSELSEVTYREGFQSVGSFIY